MKTLSIFILTIALFSCKEQYKKIAEPFPNFLTSQNEWITYEGHLPAEGEQEKVFELKLKPGSIGSNSYYTMHESLGEINVFAMGSLSQGVYTVLYGPKDQNIIQLNVKLLRSWSSGKKPEYSSVELFFKNKGDHELVLLDSDLSEASPGYSLVRRSNLFTVEGYITFVNDTSDFFERNTGQNWALAKLGKYPEADSTYKLLAKEKFEGIYMKALGYSVHHIAEDGKEIEALVFKNILKMDSMEDLNRIN